MWNDSFEKGTHSNEVIKLRQLSLDLSFFLDCLWWKYVYFSRHSWEWSFSVHYWKLFSLLLLKYRQLSVVHSLPSSGVSSWTLNMGILKTSCTHIHSPPCTHEHTLAKLISRATLHGRTHPASHWVDVFTPTLSGLRDVCLLAGHSSDLLQPGTFPILSETISASPGCVCSISPCRMRLLLSHRPTTC